MKQSIRKTTILILLAFSCFSLQSQSISKKEDIKTVRQADVFYYYDEDFEKAASIYESLLKIYPDNANLTAKLGICYLNIDGKKAEAMRLLDKASKNIVAKDNEYIEYGDKAPLDTYLYRAIACHRNDSLNKAISLFYEARKKLGRTEIFRDDYMETQIKACRYAIEMQKNPVIVVANLFVQWLAEYPGATNPVISKNDSVFIFTQVTKGKTRILCSYKSDTWKKPMDITEQLGGIERYYSNSISGDGRLLIIYMNDGGDGNLYYSQRKGSIWTKVKSLGRSINSIYWESHGFITPDGETLYFASNRPEGAGELDIWVSEKDGKGAWKKPVNCGRTINTPYNENTPFYDTTTNTLLFSSEGHVTMGGYDMFRSINKNGSWSRPIGLPFTLNNTSDNSFFIMNCIDSGFVASLYNEEAGARNIYTLETEEKVDKVIEAHGTISLQDGMAVDPKQTRIELSDQRTGALIKNISLTDTSSFKFQVKPGDFRILISHIGYKTDTINLNVKKEPVTNDKTLFDTASFRFEVNPGEYKLLVSHTGYKADTINLNIPLNTSGNYISVDVSLIPEKVAQGNFLSIKNILFDYNSYSLTEKAGNTLETLKSVLSDYPGLKIEVAGYTDSIGGVEYNIKLADKRAQTVINYLTDKGISSSRFMKRAYGKANFTALNTNNDGTDNPEGRKYNRRVVFGIIDPGTGVIIRQETYTPKHLRQPYSAKYGIILIRTEKELSVDYFKNLEKSEMNFINPIKVDSSLLYVIETFYNKIDAATYLEYVKKNGFRDAYIATQSEIHNAPESLPDPESNSCQIDQETQYNLGSQNDQEHILYTIQLKASRKPLNMSLFDEINGVREIASADGYYRYVYGEYYGFSKAKAALVTIPDSKFKNAFIRELYPLIKK